MNRELLQLIKENPDLPVYAYVDGELCGDDSGYWMGEFGKATIKEFAKVPSWGYFDTDIVYKDDWEDYANYLLETNEQFTKSFVENHLRNLDWKKAIFVYVEMPKY